MQDLLRLLAKHSYIFVFLFLEVICFYLIVQNNQKQRDIYLNSSNVISGKVYQKINKLKRLFEMDELFDSLMAENIDLREKLAQNQYTSGSDPQTVQDSIAIKHYSYLHAKIVDKTLNLRNNIFTLNKGYLDGIEKGMGVIVDNGVVGIVNKVGKYFSTVNPLLNSRTSISVVHPSSGAIGNLTWNGNHPKKMTIDGIPKHIRIKEGDLITTSGFSLFPRGIEIGKISESIIQPGSNFHTITILLDLDINTVYNVLVVKNLLLDNNNGLKPEADGL